jgi:hypothetical protein
MTMFAQSTFAKKLLRRCVSLVAVSCCACTGGEGEVDVRIWGEAFIEEGIPAAELVDGWEIGFDRFEVELRDVSVAGVSFDAPDSFDLAEPSEGRGQLIGRAAAPADAHDDAAFTLVSVSIEGSAEQAGVTKTFAWTFDTAVAYADCETETEVPRGGVGELQITVHADHLFYDSLVAEAPALRFDAIAAADTDNDGEVTMAELAATSIGAYDPGNLAIDDLWSFLAAQAQTMGHVDGEAHCES